jgi:hypothetical protein
MYTYSEKYKEYADHTTIIINGREYNTEDLMEKYLEIMLGKEVKNNEKEI